MAKIIKLNEEELKFLRKKILKKYKENAPYDAKNIKINAYKENYTGIRSNMISKCPEKLKASIGLSRIYKLFYLTDPELCSHRILRKPNFGVLFLDACYYYISDGQHTRKKFLNQKNSYTGNNVKTFYSKPNVNRWIVGGLIVISVFSLLFFYYSTRKAGLPQREILYLNNSQDYLNDPKWKVENPDRTFLSYLKAGKVCPPTLPGDFSLTADKKLNIKNLLIRDIGCGDCCTINTNIYEFSPDENSQQAGLFLFNRELDYKNFIAYTMGFTTEDSDPGEGIQRVTRILVKNGNPVDTMHFPFRRNVKVKGKLPPHHTYLEINIDRNMCTYFLKRGNSDYLPFVNQDLKFEGDILNFKVKYVALGAFQDPVDDENPGTADTLLPWFRYLFIRPCGE